MNYYNNLINKNNLKVNKVTIKGCLTIIDTPLGKYVLKRNDDIQKYNYLLSRGFVNIPEIVDYDQDAIMFKYIEAIEYDEEEKVYDYIKLLSLLHAKTVYYKDVDKNEYKFIYDSIYNKLNELNIYYNNLINKIESKEYMSSAEYLVVRNISMILSSISFCFSSLDSWFNSIDKSKKRVVTLHNSNRLSNILRDINNSYLIDFSKSYIDIPIIDLVNFYNYYYEKIDFKTILDKYEKIFVLNEDEKNLLYILISIPEKIIISNSIKDIHIIKTSINKLYITLKFLNSEEKEGSSTQENKNN